MYLIILLGLLAGQPLNFSTSLVITGNGAISLEQQELQQLRLEQQIQKQVREEIDRSFNRMVILLYIVLILTSGLPLVSLGFYWFIHRNLNLELTKAVQSLTQISQQLTTLESLKQSNHQHDQPPSYQSSDHPNDESNYQPDKQQTLEQSIEQVQDAINPITQKGEYLGNLSPIIASKDKIMQELANHLPPLSQEKVFAEQQAKLTELSQQLTILLADYPDLPLTVEDYTNHAHALYFLGQDSSAITLYNRSLNLNAEQPHAWYQKGAIHLKQEEYKEAIAAYNQALNFQAEYAPSWYKIAYCYAMTGELDPALSHLQRAVNLNPIFRTRARMSPDFEMLKQNERFQSIINN